MHIYASDFSDVRTELGILLDTDLGFPKNVLIYVQLEDLRDRYYTSHWWYLYWFMFSFKGYNKYLSQLIISICYTFMISAVSKIVS